MTQFRMLIRAEWGDELEGAIKASVSPNLVLNAHYTFVVNRMLDEVEGQAPLNLVTLSILAPTSWASKEMEAKLTKTPLPYGYPGRELLWWERVPEPEPEPERPKFDLAVAHLKPIVGGVDSHTRAAAILKAILGAVDEHLAQKQ